MSTSEEFYKHFHDFTWDFTPDQIAQRTRKIIDQTKNMIDSIVSLPEEKISFNSVVEEMALDEALQEREKNMIGLILSVSPEQSLRDAANSANKIFSDFCIEMEMRIDLYDILNKVREKEKNLPNEQERYLDKILLYKKRNGLHLPKEKRDELEIILKEIMNLCIDFNRNLSEEDVKLKFKKSDLLGMREDFIENLSKDGDDLIVTLKYPHVVPILKQCSVVKTRQIIEKAYNSRCIDSNVKILEKLIKLRHKRAHILGYSTHADFITEILMSKNGLTVRNFLEDLALKLRDSAKIEMSRLLELKKEDCLNFEIPFDCKINPYDFSYYQRIVEEKDFMVNQNVIKEYFPFEYVTEKLLELYQSLLSVRFAKVEGTKTWHPEVTLYAVFDEESQELLGYFYLDLFPREGKYTHAACFGIQSASATKFGNQVGCAAMVANFTKPSPDKPSLLTHDEVETYFHEFGHVMHHICSRTHYCLFHGTSVERDFVEAPSQMLENWVWEEESLKLISSHFITKERLGDELIFKLCKSRLANISLYYMRQIALSIFDHKIHTCNEADTFEIYKQCSIDYLGYEPTPGTNFSASFGHMCGEYDAQYYGYLWSQVYSCDMFISRFKKEGIFNTQTGKSYRKCILEPGSTKDGIELLRNFLGRDPIQEPFLQIAGIKTI